MHVYLTDIRQGVLGGANADEWRTAPDGPFVFPNCLPTPPIFNWNLPEQNYLSLAIHVAGLVFMFIALTTALASAVLVTLRSDAVSIRQAQPPFLLLLIFGTIMMSFAMLTFAFDESTYGFTDSMLDAACTATPFLVFMGYNIVYTWPCFPSFTASTKSCSFDEFK